MLEIGDVKNIVDPRLDGDPDINSVWKAIEVAMICVSPTSIEWPTMTYVVMELKQCLAMELARGHEGFETNSNQINGINYVHTGQTPTLGKVVTNKYTKSHLDLFQKSVRNMCIKIKGNLLSHKHRPPLCGLYSKLAPFFIYA